MGLFTSSAIRKARNKFIFPARSISYHHLCMFIIFELVHGRMFIHGFSHGLNIIQPISCNLLFFPCHGLLLGILGLNLNMNGLSKGNFGPAACGGVRRDCCGRFLGDLCQRLAMAIIFLQIYAIIISIEFAYQRSCRCVWLESDSSNVIFVLHLNDFDPP